MVGKILRNTLLIGLYLYAVALAVRWVDMSSGTIWIAVPLVVVGFLLAFPFAWFAAGRQ